MTLTPPNFIAPTLSALFGTGLSQHARLLTLSTAQGADLPDTLVVERFTGQEAVNGLFHFDIDALSVSADLDLKQFIGCEITLRMLQADGSRRAWHGYCTEAAWLGCDGGVARYRLRLDSFLAFLGRRRDSFVFQDRTATEIVTALLADYTQANFRFDVTQTLIKRPIFTQYRETDLAFFIRLLASEGLSWRFTHAQECEDGSNGNTADSHHARHQLVIFDSVATAPAMPGGYETIRFHRIAATESLDAITDFRAARAVQSNAVTLASWDPTQLVAPAAEDASRLLGAVSAGTLPSLPVFEGAGERGFATAEQAALQCQLMLQALELGNKSFEGAGAVRQLAAGHAFALTQHDRYAEGMNAFKVLAVTHAAINNFAAGRVSAGGVTGPSTLEHFRDLEPGTYRNTFRCVRQAVPIVPLALAQRLSPTAVGTQSALVVGVPGAVITTERDHRIKVQFAWQRGIAPNAGGLTDTGNLQDKSGNAPGSEASGTWVRVAEALAGPNWGTQFVPRIGGEVLVDFIAGDIDRPVVVAQLYNGVDLPPYSAGVDAATNHAGVVSGWHSHALDGGGFNQWVVDDTQAQLRMRLASSSAASQVNLGYLVAQSAPSAQRGSYRGAGFELRSDAWGVVRGGDGVLLSSAARLQSGASIAGTQMDAAEAVAQLKGAQALSTALTDAATQQKALSSANAHQAQADFIGATDPQDKGLHPASVNGQSAQKAKVGNRTLDAAQPVERFAAPMVLMASPATINWASPASTAIFAGGQLQWTSGTDTHWAAAETLSTVSGYATALFTHTGGIQVIAGNGPVSLQAHTDALEILADQAVTVVSVQDCIEIKANQKITLQAGQSSITLEGGNITFACPRLFSVKGGVHMFDAGASGRAQFNGNSAALLNLASVPAAYSQLINVVEMIHNDPDLIGSHYEIWTKEAIPRLLAQGMISETATSVRVFTEKAEDLDIIIGENGWNNYIHFDDNETEGESQ